MPAPVISIVGKSGSGKTTLIERLIPALLRRGLKVGTVKHDVHRFEIDHPGKDTFRHFQAGSCAVLISSPEKLALIKRTEGPTSLDELIERYLDGLDLVLTEGYKSADKPKIEVFRRDAHHEPLCGPGDNLVAMVTDAGLESGCPKFGLDQIEEVADFIIKKFLGRSIGGQ